MGWLLPNYTYRGVNMAQEEYGLHTRAIHGGERPDPTTGAVVPPLVQSTTYHFESAEEAAATFAGDREGYVYTRWGNPTQTTLEGRIASLEGARGCLATASGMAAVATALFTIVQQGDHIVSSSSVYSGTFDLMSHRLPRLGVEITLVDAFDTEGFAQAMQENTVAVYLETPGNPTLAISDIAAIAQMAKAYGATVLVDNTFATPLNQRPLELGADVVIYSATKYFCGHGDAMAGAIVADADFVQRANEEVVRNTGGIISPFNAWLILRGLQTFPLRMACHNVNAMEVARFLEGHPRVEKVIYPGLPSHPQYHIATKQMDGFGGMVCFEVKGGIEGGRWLMNRVQLCTLAVSLGDNRTLICHPASTTHAPMSREDRLASGISDGLVRLSVGTEDVDDIIYDLDQALG
jgi:methionine-gamma-lyase